MDVCIKHRSMHVVMLVNKLRVCSIAFSPQSIFEGEKNLYAVINNVRIVDIEYFCIWFCRCCQLLWVKIIFTLNDTVSCVAG